MGQEGTYMPIYYEGMEKTQAQNTTCTTLRFQLKYLDILTYYVLKQVMFKFPLFTSSLIDWHKPKLYQLILVFHCYYFSVQIFTILLRGATRIFRFFLYVA